MRDVIIKCDKGEVKKTLAYIEKKDSGVRWASEDKPTEYGSWFEEDGVYLIIKNDVLTFIEIEEFQDSDKKGKDVVSADEFLGKSKSPHIVIFRRGRNVIAKDVATGNEGIAKCSPNDDFCFKTGASIALARLLAKTPDALNHDVKDEWIKALGLTPVEKKVYTDADRNFKVGDRVVVRDWDDMEREFEYRDGGIRKKGCFTSFIDSMRHLCGRTATVVRVYDTDRVEVNFDDKSGNINYFYRSWMFNPTNVKSDKNPEAKFKVGDHVTLKEDIASGKRYGSLMLWSGRMYDLANGKRLEVEDVVFHVEDGMYHYYCRTADDDRYFYTEAMLDKWDESVIHEGDTVKVIDTGLNYSSYVQWVGEHISDPYMAARFCFGTPDTSKEYKVIKIAEHERNHMPLAYIEETDGLSYNRCYLIEVKGLEKV